MGRQIWWFIVVFSGLFQSILSSNVSPDDEDETSWLPFMEILDDLSGLGSYEESERHQINDIDCPTETCIVNVDGDIVWDIRMQLYSEQMVQNIEESDGDATISLDGCLNSTTVDDYNTCMQQVRTRMITFLDSFDQLFKNQLEQSCNETLFSVNCITLNN